MRSPVKKIAVLAPDQELYPTVMGVVRYGRERGNWNVFVELDVDVSTYRRLRSWDGHGVIAHVSTPEKARAVRQLSVPVVNISSAIERLSVPRVTTDQEAIGASAARHLMERGFTRFAFLGITGLWFSKLRQRGFERCVREAGYQCDTMDGGEEARSMLFWGRGTESVAEWLRGLTPPVGVMAVFDYLGAAAVQICGTIGLRVPYDVGVIGTDNDPTVCESTGVPLSSVSRDWLEQGYVAARLLDRLMQGGRPPERDILLPPGPIVQRRSTDVLVTDCPKLAPAIRYIEQHLAEPFGTKALVRELGMSRRWLYTQFAKSFGCPPYDYIMRLRVDRAKRMLSRPDPVQLREIVEACGFSSERHLRTVMIRVMGMSPSQYRRVCERVRAAT